MYSLLRAKGFTSAPPVGHILILVPRFDREFVDTTGQKYGARFEFNFVFHEDLCLN